VIKKDSGNKTTTLSASNLFTCNSLRTKCIFSAFDLVYLGVKRILIVMLRVERHAVLRAEREVHRAFTVIAVTVTVIISIIYLCCMVLSIEEAIYATD